MMLLHEAVLQFFQVGVNDKRREVSMSLKKRNAKILQRQIKPREGSREIGSLVNYE